MIIVEISVPYIDKKYEFKLNEDIPVSVIIEELCSVISEKEQCPVTGGKDKLMLFNVDRGVALSGERTLYESNISVGDSLILI
ncbi:MAG: hypothetical protein E7563_01615 [Ruminococcaceae bacterium]|nr:hypothetical protein [Oscillospiraceae bacterium]MBQ7385243.1 hypothetical protein [Ruminococcus sp.]